MLSEEFSRHGLTLLVHPIPPGEQPLTGFWRTMSPAGVVSLDVLRPADVTLLREHGTPIAALAYDARDDGVPHLVVPNADHGRAQADHLVRHEIGTRRPFRSRACRSRSSPAAPCDAWHSRPFSTATRLRPTHEP